ncbi:hypothetical protein KC19_7G118700 [Ceratodon purpureus]|uniref:Uncharacterized protein n=1 Tax=Ceratodon purpureus TaxID=3225 RepID=A0A8T0H7J0_CERPU|nr:hypothetical protein KC19_7G118700 [Ceratodon purpureus]
MFQTFIWFGCRFFPFNIVSLQLLPLHVPLRCCRIQELIIFSFFGGTEIVRGKHERERI